MTYESLRARLTDPGTTAKGMEAFFTGWAMRCDSITAALVCLAACDVPMDRAAQLTAQDPAEVDALVSRFGARMLQSIREERDRRQGGDPAA